VIQCVTASDPAGKVVAQAIDLAAAHSQLTPSQGFSASSHAWYDVSIERVLYHRSV
jgi:hypothetical protein